MNHYYIIRLTDTDHTYNINMRSFHCFAVSEAEAMGKMLIERPDLAQREILGINLIY